MKTRHGFLGLALIAAGAIALTGCTIGGSIPKTTVTGSLGGQPFALTTPKDNDLRGLEVSCDTNGTVHLHIDSLTSTLNPTNIANTAVGQAALIDATGRVVIQGIQAGAAAAGTAMGAAVKAP